MFSSVIPSSFPKPRLSLLFAFAGGFVSRFESVHGPLEKRAELRAVEAAPGWAESWKGPDGLSRKAICQWLASKVIF